MDKIVLRNQLVERLEQELGTLLHASDQAHASATHSESKAENKYDTRGLEAAYLAHGLSVRAQELADAVATLRAWIPRAYGDADRIGTGALVILEDEAGGRRQLFLAPQGGGLKLPDAEGEIAVVSLGAPLAQTLLGRELEDEVTLTTQGQRRRYWISGLY